MKLVERLVYMPVHLRFGTSGLRGLVTDMTDLECYINTLAFLHFCQDRYPGVSTLYVGGDFRNSTPRIVAAVAQAGMDANFEVKYLGILPTPSLALSAFLDDAVSIMVTGSHIPEDRNGIKYYKPDQELLKQDEDDVLASVQRVRESVYASEGSRFSEAGMLVAAPNVEVAKDVDVKRYEQRFKLLTDGSPLSGLKIGVYEHSSVGRDLLCEVLESAGAEVLRYGRSEKFIPVDTENVTKELAEQLARYVTDGKLDALVSLDGDADRPLFVDEGGMVHSGDLLGLITAELLKIESCAYPVSANDMLDTYLQEKGVMIEKTKIGSPYVVDAINAVGEESTAGWEVNGGFLVGDNVRYNGKELPALKTRDGIIPLLCTLIRVKQNGGVASQLFDGLRPLRHGDSGLVDLPDFDAMQRVLEYFSSSPTDLGEYFTQRLGFGEVESINYTDGTRIRFKNGDVAHVRGSNNAPQLRVYATADTKARARQIVDYCIDSGGIYETVQRVVLG